MPSEFEVIQEAERFCLKRKIIKKMRYQHSPSEAAYNPNINIKTAPQPRFFLMRHSITHIKFVEDLMKWLVIVKTQAHST